MFNEFRFRTFILLLIALSVILLIFGFRQEKTQEVRPNIILMIGDGMGVSQVTAATYWNPEESNFYRFDTVGLIETSSTSHKVTDSAAGATAYSTGQKTYKTAIGVAPDSTKLPTILEQLRDQGYQTGLVSLSSITGATPAVFYAHVPNRDMHEEIAAQLVEANIDLFIGGGRKYFIEREDERDLLQELKDGGYALDSLALPSQLDENMKHGLLMAEDSLPLKNQGRTDFLQQAALLAIDYFRKNDRPYFLMIEGSFIDWAGHFEDADLMIREAVDFDRTIGAVLDETEPDPNTLTVVTADHETGGAAIGKYFEENETGDLVEVPDTLAVYFHYGQHTAALVPVFAKGYKEELFSGVYSNHRLYHKLKEITQLPD